MAKTKYQEAATDYARKYLDHLLKKEDTKRHDMNSSLDQTSK